MYRAVGALMCKEMGNAYLGSISEGELKFVLDMNDIRFFFFFKIWNP